ncbi:MAG: glycosyltransferase [Bacteroidia bacterium]
MDFNNISFHFDELLLQYILTGVFAFFVFIQLIYFSVVFSRLVRRKPKSLSLEQPPVSVIICARNEIKNLRTYLEKILNQNYPQFQVVVVNDCSWDETELYLEVMEKRYENLKVVTLKEQERYRHGKKFALALGIKAAQYERMLMTDADCEPASENWIAEMMKSYTEGKEIVLGYGAYMKEPSLLNKWIRFETAFNSMLFLNYALGRNAYMGVGRNLSYKKELFFEKKGFAKHQHLLSGDDDLFVNESATRKNVAVCVIPDAFTYSKPKETWGDWFKQKKRHLSTNKYYRFRHKISLALFHVSQTVFWLMGIVLLALQIQVPIVASLFGLRIIAMLIIINGNFKKLQERDLIWLSPFLELIMIAVYPFVAIASRFHKNQTWS